MPNILAAHAKAEIMKSESLLQLSKKAFGNWMDDYAPSMGAALAYYTAFSVAPLLVIAIAVAALIFGQDVAHAAIMDQARGLIGENGANAIEGLLVSAQKPEQGVLASTLGILVLLIGATTVFAELESSLNRIWKVAPQQGSGVWHFIRTRLLSVGMLLAIGFLLIISLVVSAAVAIWSRYLSGWFGGPEALLHAANFVVSVAVITVLFATIYRFMPRVKIRWRAGRVADLGLLLRADFSDGCGIHQGLCREPGLEEKPEAGDGGDCGGADAGVGKKAGERDRVILGSMTHEHYDVLLRGKRPAWGTRAGCGQSSR
jgi:YihY family inner membrane protein